MKKICALIGLVFLLTGCEEIEKSKNNAKIFASNSYTGKPYGNIGDGVRVYISIIDEHEYLIVCGYRSMGITHKADCKFCKDIK